MADEKTLEAAGATAASTAAPAPADAPATQTLERVNVSPAQTWNRLRANDVTLTVPFRSRKGDVYFALPRLFEAVECGMGEKVTAWVRSQAADARYLEVKAGTRRDEPIVVEVGAGDVADTGVMVRAGAEATIVVAAHAGAADGEKPAAPAADGALPTSASLLRVIAEAGARVSIVEVLGAGAGRQHLESVGIQAAKGARVDVRQYVLGADTTALGLAADLAGDAARFDLSCRYYAAGTDELDINHLVRMRGRNTRANVTESGILDNAAKKSLRATIDLVHGAKGAQGNEAETVLVLGDDVVNKTVPSILCDEDDVAGNHGATIGSVSPEQMTYLQNRGLSRQEAEGLFVRALFEDAIMQAPEAASASVAVAQAERVLGAEVAHDFESAVADAAGAASTGEVA